MSSIFELIGLLEDAINRSPKPRMGGANKRLIDYDQILDILGDLRVSIPDEVRQAQAIITEKNSILEDAKYRSSSMLSDARIQSERMISEQGIIEEIQKRGKEIVSRSEEKADVIIQGARTYTDQILLDVKKYLEEHIKTVEENRQELQTTHTSEQEMKVRSAAEDELIKQAAQERVDGMLQEETEMDTEDFEAVYEEAFDLQEDDKDQDGETDIYEEKSKENIVRKNKKQQPDEFNLYEQEDYLQENEEDLRKGIEIEVGRSLFLQDDELDMNQYGFEKNKTEKKQEYPKKDRELDKDANKGRFPWE